MFFDLPAGLLAWFKGVIDASFFNTPVPVLPFEGQPILEFRVSDIDAFQQFVGDLVGSALCSQHFVGVEHDAVHIQPHRVFVRDNQITVRTECFIDVQKSLP